MTRYWKDLPRHKDIIVTDYLKLITAAIRVTVNTPLLWFFGLFLSAGFNFNWFYLSRNKLALAGAAKWLEHMWQAGLGNLQQFVPGVLLALLIIIAIWIGVNWIKTVFILNVADLLDVKRLGADAESLTIWQKQKKLFREAKKFLAPVTALSLFTIMAQATVTFVLLGPWVWQKYITPLPGMMAFATVLFIVFMLFFSLLNFFAVLFVVLYQKKFHEAFSQATNFMGAKAKPLSAACFILLLLYVAGLLAGSEAARGVKFLFFEIGSQLGVLNLAREQVAWRLEAVSLLFLLWLGFLNAFFNVGLFVFFQKFVKPRQFEAENISKANLILKVSVDKTL